jgi:hypothetical protein
VTQSAQPARRASTRRSASRQGNRAPRCRSLPEMSSTL